MSDIKVYLLGESGKAALGAASRAEAAADGVTQARDVAVAASLTAPNVYTSTSAGLAAVGEGQTFWVSSGDSLVLYRDVSGVATLVYTMTRGLATVADLGDLAALPIDVASAYVEAVDADYAWQAGSDLTPDGWAVVEPDGGEDGNWVLASDALTLPASGSRVTDTANANAAGVSLAANGKALRLLPTTYLFTQWIFPIVGALIVNASPQTVIDLDLEPDGSPATAGLYCAPGSVASTTTVSASNTVSNYTVSVAGTVTVGKFVRIGIMFPAPGFTARPTR